MRATMMAIYGELIMTTQLVNGHQANSLLVVLLHLQPLQQQLLLMAKLMLLLVLVNI